MTQDLITNGGWMFVHIDRDESQKENPVIINAICEISEIEKNELDLFNRQVETAIRAIDVLDAVHVNACELVELIVTTGKSHIEEGTILNESFENLSMEVSRRLLNLCASFNAMIKHQDAVITREHGKNSWQYCDWEKTKKELREKSIEYSLIYGLRNFIEHVGMPEISYNINASHDGKVVLNFSLERSSFLGKDVKLGTELKKIFKQQPDKISLFLLINGWDKVFQKLAFKIVQLRIGDVRCAAGTISQLRSKYLLPDNGKIGFCKFPKLKNKPSDLNLSISWISEANAIRLENLLADIK